MTSAAGALGAARAAATVACCAGDNLAFSAACLCCAYHSGGPSAFSTAFGAPFDAGTNWRTSHAKLFAGAVDNVSVR
jgi:hypothetical protein